jgi:hypothetical protein
MGIRMGISMIFEKNYSSLNKKKNTLYELTRDE